MARFFRPPSGSRTSTGWDVPKELLNALGQLFPGKGVIVLFNFNTGGSPQEDRQVDLAVITPRAIHVVEIKNYRHPVFATPNGHWFVQYPNGERKPIVNRRGRQAESPVVQAQRNKKALLRAIKRHFRVPATLSAFAYVLLPYAPPESSIETRVPEGTIVCVSIPEFLNALAYNERRAQGVVSPFLIDQFAVVLGLEEDNAIAKRKLYSLPLPSLSSQQGAMRKPIPASTAFSPQQKQRQWQWQSPGWRKVGALLLTALVAPPLLFYLLLFSNVSFIQKGEIAFSATLTPWLGLGLGDVGRALLPKYVKVFLGWMAITLCFAGGLLSTASFASLAPRLGFGAGLVIPFILRYFYPKASPFLSAFWLGGLGWFIATLATH